MANPGVAAKSPSELALPLSQETKDGRYIFRTGWDELHDSYVTITFNPWLHNIQGPNYPGGFTIDRKGPQVVRQGGTSGHDPGSLSTGPSNILIFPDRNVTETTGPYDDSGGQRMIGGEMRGSIDFVDDGPIDLRDEVRYSGADLAAKWTYTGATEVSGTNTSLGSDGKTYLTPLLPTERTIVKVGGPDAAGQSWTAGSHEYETPYGVLNYYTPIPDAETEQYMSGYRIEITPASLALEDKFLNVVEVGDSGAAKSPTAKLEGSNTVGARVGDRVAVFSQTDSRLSSGDFTIDASGDYGVLVADLESDAPYNVDIGGEVSSLTASPAGTLYLSVAASSEGTRVAFSLGELPPPQAGQGSSSSATSSSAGSTEGGCSVATRRGTRPSLGGILFAAVGLAGLARRRRARLFLRLRPGVGHSNVQSFEGIFPT